MSRRLGVVGVASAFVLIVLVAGIDAGFRALGPAAPHTSYPPVLAYYYIWFESNSWDRAKKDRPILGDYSSDDRAVMEQHMRWAKDAGIDGFIVSWKSTPKLDRRLALLVDVARAVNFKLAIIYQGLDFERQPLLVDKVDADLRSFAQRYGADPVFDIFGSPLIVWSGTWNFTREDVARVADAVRPGLLLLGSERDVEGIRRLAGIVDGDAYYWSSVDPTTQVRYAERLAEMGAAARENGGIWIAPAAPGFDARLVGGTRDVARNDGATLRLELDAAFSSAPDAIGLISWNEFSENSHVEPSSHHRDRYLEVLRGYPGVVTAAEQVDSSEEAAEPVGWAFLTAEAARQAAVGFIAALLLASVVVLLRRRLAARGIG